MRRNLWTRSIIQKPENRLKRFHLISIRVTSLKRGANENGREFPQHPWRRGPPSRVRITSRFHQSGFSGGQRWQTFLFVRNQMDRTWSKDQSTSTILQATRSPLTIDQRSRSAAAELRQTSLSATARTARLAFKPPRQSTQRAPKLNPDFRTPSHSGGGVG